MLFISNWGFLKKADAFSFISVPILIGILLSPEYGLIPILPSTQSNLSWAIRVALTWITFISGTNLLLALPDSQQLKKLLPLFLGFILFVITTFTLLFVFFAEPELPTELTSSSFKLFLMALILSSVIFSSKENPFLLPIFFLCLLYFFKDTEQSLTLGHLVMPLGVGLLMAIVCRLIISPKDKFDTASLLTLIGLCTMGTGLAIGTNSLEVILGLSFGWTMAFVHKYGVCSDPRLKHTVIPIKFVIALFSGLLVDITVPALVLGTSLALTRITLKVFVLNISSPTVNSRESLISNLPISMLALPIVLSLQLSTHNNADTKLILSCFCIAFIVNDIMALVLEKIKRKDPLSEYEGANV